MIASFPLSKFFSPTLFMAAFSLFATAAHAEGLEFEMAPPPACDSSDSSCLIIEQNHSIELSDIGRIEFVAVQEDSRCPVDVFCFWAGQVKVVLKKDSLDGAEKFVVGLGGNLESAYIDGRTGKAIVLEQVWPERSFSNPVEKPYQIKLRLEDPNTAQEDEDEGDSGDQQDDAAQQDDYGSL